MLERDDDELPDMALMNIIATVFISTMLLAADRANPMAVVKTNDHYAEEAASLIKTARDHEESRLEEERD